MLTVECPSNSATTFGCVPLCRCIVATECRKSSNRILGAEPLLPRQGRYLWSTTPGEIGETLWLFQVARASQEGAVC